MLAGVGTVTGNLNRLSDILLQIVACRCGIGRRQSIHATDEGFQRNGVGIGPGVAVAGNGLSEAVITLLVGLHQVQRRTVTATAVSTCTRNTNGEVVGLEGAVLCRHTTAEDNLTHSIGIAPAGVTNEQSLVV